MKYIAGKMMAWLYRYGQFGAKSASVHGLYEGKVPDALKR